MSITLTSRERAALKSRAHHLNPVVQVGKAALSEAFVAEVDRELSHHELIKIRIGGDDRAARTAVCDELCARTGAASIQRVGKILVLWRPRPEEA